MTIKTILVPLRGAAEDRAALNAAFSVARAFEAHVEALFVTVDPRDTVPLLGEGMSGAMVDEIMRAAEDDSHTHLARAHRMFEEAVRDASIPFQAMPPGREGPSARFRETAGRMEEVVPAEARYFDLMLFVHCPVAENPQGFTVMESALLSAGRPLLLVPKSPPETIGRTVAVAWNGNRESARVACAAMPFLRDAETVHVLTAETSATRAAAGARFSEHLAWHGIQAPLTVVAPNGGSVGRALVDRAAALGADLLVMGGYGHGRMREMILGGVTRDVLGHGGLPVLLAH
ncbi:universal stress protein [Azospirillum sp. SYSU D00513]|uniref:universal stress protein n=1 Tax=Azospirillum sp. SYSU D00513 TaxID=2812561 RepID=UPI001A95BEFA|nr:universal stress protein [Azospirillum sp. SYSU D00513]